MIDPDSLPVVDISPFLSTSSSSKSRASCVASIASACRDVGFFYLIGHGVPESVTDEIISLARQFFLETPASEKELLARKEPGDSYGDGARGYQRLAENVTNQKHDWQEAIDFYKEETQTASHHPPYQLLKGRNLFPGNPPQLERKFKSYIETMKCVGTAVVQAMGQALDLDPSHQDVFVNATRDSYWVMRMIGYPPLPATNETNGRSSSEDRTDSLLEQSPSNNTKFDDAEGQSCGAHTDYGCVTLLLADPTTGALQVRARDNTWINADPVPGAFVVNIGDMIERWTNGEWKSTEHRVLHRGQGYRVSVPFFFEPDWDAVVKPLEKCVRRCGERRFGGVKYGDHLTKKVLGNFG
jgi:isopenicillin N synthase-like dioxygenase